MLENLKKLKQQLETLAESRASITAANRFNDPVAERTSWHPLKRGGSNFRTHQLRMVTPLRAEFRPSLLNLLFGLAFTGGAPLLLWLMQQKAALTQLHWLLGLLFSSVGFALLYFGTRPIVFDLQRQQFWKGWHAPAPQAAISQTHTTLDQIHALQIVGEYCKGNNNRGFRSYELNLVLSNGERINVIDHGNLERLRQDARTLAGLLGKPVWDAE